jgi:hypothetical protein
MHKNALMNPTQRLLGRTATRLRLVMCGVWFRRAFLGSALLFLVLLLAARLLGTPAIRFAPWAPAVVPLAAFVAALAGLRRLADATVARVIDTQGKTKDLFLTTVLAGDDNGEFRPVVCAAAEKRAAELQPARIVPLNWTRGAVEVVLALAVLVAGLRWLPQLDPFRKVAQRDQLAQQAQQLAESKKITIQRAEVLAIESEKQSAQLKEALARLDKTFKDAKPQEREASMQRLAEDQKELGELWRKVNTDGLKQALEKGVQSFGRMDAQKLAEWREQLKKGDISGLKKELEEMRAQLQKLAAQTDPAEKQAQQEALAQRLNQLAEALKQSAGSPQLDAALARAQTQLDKAKLNQLSPEAMEATMDSLQLSEQELKQLAQSLKDGQALEEALKNLQMAKQLAAHGKLDGEEAKDAQEMADYAELFAKKMAELGEIAGVQGGPNMNQGVGDGSKRPEDDSVTTGFKSEKSTSALTGGKMLLEWKTKEVGETGARVEEFRDAVREVKQGVSEAIQQEQVPPGYHEAIKKYFDTLPAK